MSNFFDDSSHPKYRLNGLGEKAGGLARNRLHGSFYTAKPLKKSEHGKKD
jgi:hypothetical protein